MANNTFALTISGNSTYYLTGLTVNGVSNAINPTLLDVTTPGIVAALEAELNAFGLGIVFTVAISGTNFIITSSCTPSTVNSIGWREASTPHTLAFTPTACGALVICTNVTATVTGTLTVGCTSGLVFGDTTGAYNSGSNPNGYGGANVPGIPAITGTQFQLYDSTESVLIGTFLSSYLPNAAGTSTVTLMPSNFGLTVFAPGTSYILTYGVIWTGPTTSICLVDSFTYPCCGSPIPSNLATNFSITEVVGNGSLVFTDTTGTYSPFVNAQNPGNPGGYGSPNPAYSDITSTLIVVTLENGTVVQFTTFIPTASIPTFVITAAQLGYNQTIPDQIIEVQYWVYTATACAIGAKTNYILLYGMSQACVNAQIQGLLAGSCSCNDDNCSQTDYITNMLFQLDAIKIAAQSNMACIQGRIQAFYNQCVGGCSSCL